ncbi:MAG: hypothetical protein RJB38_2230 [Pseudomonadota bacterium]|jgi:hypothetical protein
MRIQTNQDLYAAGTLIPKGEYQVALRSDSQQIHLTDHGMDINLAAVRRKMNCKVKFESVLFHSGGGRCWTLIVQHPKLGEWVAMLEGEK